MPRAGSTHANAPPSARRWTRAMIRRTSAARPVAPVAARGRTARPHQRLAHRLEPFVDRHVVIGLGIATLLGTFDALDHTLGPVKTPATGLLVIAPLVTAARADARRTAVVAAYASLLTVLLAPTHRQASMVDLVIVAVVALAGSVLAVTVAAARDRAERAERERARELRHLQGVVDAANEHASLDALIMVLLDRIGEALQADTAMFLLADDAGQRLVVHAATGLTTDGRAVSVASTEGFAGRVVADR